MTKKEAFDIINGADIMVLNRDNREFNHAIILALNALLKEDRDEKKNERT